MANDYDSFAEAYSAETEANLINGYYARPAILALAGDVAGRRILDAGCGSGPLFAALRDRGAIVTGFDTSAKMLELARLTAARRRRARCLDGESPRGAAVCTLRPDAIGRVAKVCRVFCLAGWGL